MESGTNIKSDRKSHTIEDRWSRAGRANTSLTNRILRINLISLLILVVGIIYLDQYREDLIKAELETLSSEVKLLSAAFSESAIRKVKTGDNNGEAIIVDLAERIIKRVSKNNESHVRIFDLNKQIIGDSYEVARRNDILQKEILSKKSHSQNSYEIIDDLISKIISYFPTRYNLPLYSSVMETSQNPDLFPDIDVAMKGEISFRAWKDEKGELVLTAAAPIEKDGKIYGAVLVKRDGKNIKEAIIRIQSDILKVFMGAMTVTILLSLYLAAVIGHPLRRLAISAENVMNSGNREMEIEDLSDRNDEIGELSISLRKMTHDLWNRMDAIEQFSADVSHELKNPLSSLKSALETMEKVTKKEQKEKLLDIIHHDIERLDRLITDISKASRLDAELSRDAMEKVKPAEIISSLINAYKKPLERIDDSGHVDNIRLVIDSKSRNSMVVANEGRLTQIFENLISNALSFSPKEGVVTIRIDSNDNDVIISVEDEGVGIPPENLENIFERFYSNRPKHEKYGSHSGLGLSICRQIVTAHKGKIYADNIVDDKGDVKGAKFTVIMPKI